MDPQRVPLTERLIIDAIDGDAPHSAICTSLGRGHLAAELSQRWPEIEVHCHHLDAYLAKQSERWLESRGARVVVDCLPDFPNLKCDLVAIPGRSQGDGELTRDWLQTGFQRLRIGGQMFVSSDNPRDTWLGEQLKRLFRKTARSANKKGVVYRGVKSEPLRKVKDYSCEFAFRDGTRLVRAFSRPGVFSHRRLDVGARALLESIEISPGWRVLDLGCGSGVVSLAIAQRAPDVNVLAVDANPRALQCTQRGAELNGLTNIETRLTADAESGEPGSFDLVVANPPYYSHFRIGELFVQSAARALRPGGILQLVTKQPDAYVSLFSEAGFVTPTATAARHYHIVHGIRP